MTEIEYVNKVSATLIEASASDDMVAMAAWVSNDQDSEARLDDQGKVKGLIDFLYRNKHMSPFEHGHFTFKIDVPLFVAREFHRHRTMSYNEVSGRYTQVKPRFWRADEARVQRGKMGNYHFEPADPEITARYLKNKERGLALDWEIYMDNLDAGMAKEQAREDMPLSTMTQFYATCNPRNLMQFLMLRNDKHALKEIRDVAVQMEDILKEQMPYTYAAYAKAQEYKDANVGDLENRITQLEKALKSSESKMQFITNSLKYKTEDHNKLQKSYDKLLTDYNGRFVKEQSETEPNPNAERPLFNKEQEQLDEMLRSVRAFVDAFTKKGYK